MMYPNTGIRNIYGKLSVPICSRKQNYTFNVRVLLSCDEQNIVSRTLPEKFQNSSREISHDSDRCCGDYLIPSIPSPATPLLPNPPPFLPTHPSIPTSTLHCKTNSAGGGTCSETHEPNQSVNQSTTIHPFSASSASVSDKIILVQVQYPLLLRGFPEFGSGYGWCSIILVSPRQE
ncbi:hypothetical protein L873DRAFT_1286992 [Choiromyces venosus 120613-1]|uniref:Uncharacterized protein n=1 Tax=Choiromyces venosus 120613-1 TaxID=1336337 RepID=A0A3N4JCC7_9PEZI|nr:hypothetical protein L873DRAFT_1286992 [Choiromyces venosus 120613-1]